MTLVITMVSLAVVLLLVNAAVSLYRKFRPHKSFDNFEENGTSSLGSSDSGTLQPNYSAGHSQGHHPGFNGGDHGGFSGHSGDFGGGHGH
jgi:hypothetical protein